MADRRRVKHHGKPAGLAGTTSTSSRTARRAELESGVPVSTSKKPRSFVPARHAGRRARPSRARGGPARRPRTRHRTPGECWDARDIWRPAAGRGWRRRGRGGTGRLAPVSVPGAGPGRPPPAGQVGWPTSPEGHRARGRVVSWTHGAGQQDRRTTGNFWKPRGHRPVWPVRARQGPRGSALWSTHGTGERAPHGSNPGCASRKRPAGLVAFTHRPVGPPPRRGHQRLQSSLLRLIMN